MKTKPKPSRAVKQLREIATWLEGSRAMNVEIALAESNVRAACAGYIDQKADAIQRRDHIAFHCKTLCRFAKARKRKCTLLPKAREFLRANDEFIDQLGKTITAIRRKYRANKNG